MLKAWVRAPSQPDTEPGTPRARQPPQENAENRVMSPNSQQSHAQAGTQSAASTQGPDQPSGSLEVGAGAAVGGQGPAQPSGSLEVGAGAEAVGQGNGSAHDVGFRLVCEVGKGFE